MPFVDLTLPERERFLKQTTGSHVPGYTGHCPTLKFRYGKRYGADTKEINEELRDISPVQFTKPYKEGDPEMKVLQDTVREKGEEFDPVVYTNLPRRSFILGYTGFIPGLNFEYGIPFSNAAHKSLTKFTRRLADEERKRQRERMQLLNTTPKMCCVRGKDEVSRAFEENTRHFFNDYVPPVQSELPPIAGYTGHIPRVKGTEASLSQRYYSAAKAGLSMLKEERCKRNYLNQAKQAVADAISYSHARKPEEFTDTDLLGIECIKTAFSGNEVNLIEALYWQVPVATARKKSRKFENKNRLWKGQNLVTFMENGDNSLFAAFYIAGAENSK